MMIKVENLPNKQIINFYPPRAMNQTGEATVVDKRHLPPEGILHDILAIKGVERCLLSDTLISVRYNGQAEDVRLPVLAEIDDVVAAEVLLPTFPQQLSDSEVAEAVADAFIRPTLNRDNGDLTILALENGCLAVKFEGHCAGCPYAQNTLQNVIVKTFRQYMPQIKTVELKE